MFPARYMSDRAMADMESHRRALLGQHFSILPNDTLLRLTLPQKLKELGTTRGEEGGLERTW